MVSLSYTHNKFNLNVTFKNASKSNAGTLGLLTLGASKETVEMHRKTFPAASQGALALEALLLLALRKLYRADDDSAYQSCLPQMAPAVCPGSKMLAALL